MGAKTQKKDGLACKERDDETFHELEVASPVVIVQAGHVGRTKGKTGTEGTYYTPIPGQKKKKQRHYLSEKQLADAVANLIKRHLDSVKTRRMRVLRYDADNVPNFKNRAIEFPVAVVAIHCNGSENKSDSGYCFGFPASHDKVTELKDTIAAAYEEVQGSHWVGTRRIAHEGKDNYTAGLRSYYVWRKMPTTAPCCLVETGYLTHAEECRVIDENKPFIAYAIALGVVRFLKAEMTLFFPELSKLEEPRPQSPG